MIPFHSQAGQDRFVFEMLVRLGCLHGIFLDIGCCEPIKLSNTYALEQVGWTGDLFDLDPNAVAQCIKTRSSRVHLADVTRVCWENFPNIRCIDYLSLDVDSATLPTLEVLLAAGVKFRVATIEHDSYRFGTHARDRMREMLTAAGYHCYVSDVASEGLPFEDWWVEDALKDIKIDRSFIETATPTP